MDAKILTTPRATLNRCFAQTLMQVFHLFASFTVCGGMSPHRSSSLAGYRDAVETCQQEALKATLEASVYGLTSSCYVRLGSELLVASLLIFLII